MASRMKEDERNEKIIRGLLKLAENRRCINCNSLGPQYVCTNFWTFVCTTCSGIHREYTHRVKSVSMAKFTSQEVSALQGGGNERAREVYFKEWDPQRHSVPDSSNVERLRDFIRHVYVDKRYAGERSIDKPPRVKMGEKDDSYENRRVDTSRGGSRSPPYDDRYDRPYSDRPGLGGRNDGYRSNYDDMSPGHDQESRYGHNYRKSPVRFEVVDDRRRDDRFGNGRKVEESKSEGRSPNRQTDTSSPPIVRPVRDILGDNVPPLRVGEPPKANGDKASDGFARTQRTASSSSLGSNDGGSVELKRENLGSLIDFNADPEPPAITSSPPAQLSTTPVTQPVTQATGPSVDGGNWASFEFAPQAPAQPQPQPQPPAQPQPPSSANTLESLLAQLSMPASAPVGNISARSSGAPAISPIDNLSMLAVSSGMTATVTNSSPPFTNSAVAATVGDIQSSSLSSSHAAAPAGMLSGMPFVDGSSTKINGGGQWPNLQQNNSSLFRANANQISVPQFSSVGQASSNQAWNSPRAHNAQAPSTTSAFSHSVSKQIQESSVPPAHSEAKTNERKALPEDLFAMTYPTGPVSIQGWHAGPPPGMGYGLQYPTAAPMHTFSQPSKPTNPFDLNNEPAMVHAPSFPSMTSLQGTLPNMGASPGLVRSSSLGNPSQHWIPPQSQSYSSPGQSPSYASAGQSPAYSSALPPSAYMGQPFSQNMPAPRNQASVGQGGEAAFFGNMSTNQQQAGRYSLPATPNPLSSGGNPFG